MFRARKLRTRRHYRNGSEGFRGEGACPRAGTEHGGTEVCFSYWPAKALPCFRTGHEHWLIGPGIADEIVHDGPAGELEAEPEILNRHAGAGLNPCAILGTFAVE
jgi:hypothetical protein